MFLTILMFAISSAHAVMVIWYANIEYLEKNAAHDSDVLQRRRDPTVYVPTLFGIINVSFGMRRDLLALYSQKY